jgi:phosphatidylglycerophosphate synthase
VAEIERPEKPTAADIRSSYDDAKRDFDRRFVIMPLFRSISFYPTAVFARLGISPNGATWLSLVLGWIGCAVMTQGSYASMLAGVILINLWSLTDYIDGNLARYFNQSSVYGRFLDQFGGITVEVGMFLCAGIGVYHRPVDSLGLGLEAGVWLISGALAALAMALNTAMGFVFRTLFMAPQPASAPRPVENLGGVKGLALYVYRNVGDVSGVVLPLLLLAALVDAMDVFVLFYAAVNVASFLATAALFVRRGSAHPQGFD